jgi:hypothetical protein
MKNSGRRRWRWRERVMLLAILRIRLVDQARQIRQIIGQRMFDEALALVVVEFKKLPITI